MKLFHRFSIIIFSSVALQCVCAHFVDPLKSIQFDSSQNVQNLIRRASGFIDSLRNRVCVSHVMSTRNNIEGNIFMYSIHFETFHISESFMRLSGKQNSAGGKRTQNKTWCLLFLAS